VFGSRSEYSFVCCCFSEFFAFRIFFWGGEGGEEEEEGRGENEGRKGEEERGYERKGEGGRRRESRTKAIPVLASKLDNFNAIQERKVTVSDLVVPPTPTCGPVPVAPGTLSPRDKDWWTLSMEEMEERAALYVFWMEGEAVEMEVSHAARACCAAYKW
jgi:hypothetical protein